jgi:hypothetical protein
LADDSGFWKVKMGAVMVDDKVAVSDDRIVILDTGKWIMSIISSIQLIQGSLAGTTLMYLPPADADAIHLLIEGAAPYVEHDPCENSEIKMLRHI